MNLSHIQAIVLEKLLLKLHTTLYIPITAKLSTWQYCQLNSFIFDILIFLGISNNKFPVKNTKAEFFPINLLILKIQ